MVHIFWTILRFLGPDPDDLLDQGYTDEQGMFMLKGDTSELTTIDPVFKVYHDCDDNLKVVNFFIFDFNFCFKFIIYYYCLILGEKNDAMIANRKL